MARKPKAIKDLEEREAATPAPAPNWGEGWGGIRPRDKVAHYYRNGQALCHAAALYRGDLEPETGVRGPDDCPKCVKRLDEIGTPEPVEKA